MTTLFLSLNHAFFGVYINISLKNDLAQLQQSFFKTLIAFKRNSARDLTAQVRNFILRNTVSTKTTSA